MIGSSIGPYRITAPLGEGGMGEVWRARDERLDRDVALKVLPAAFAAEPQRLERFEREARVLASLDHPHIATLHALEELDGRHVLVMELVEGEDLSERLARGPLPIDEAVSIAVQIAEALAAAHDRGIVHRDLKPANVRLRPDGRVKVLDFGLAKAWQPGTAATDLSHSPTLTMNATEAGMLLGTAGYMSPEQARGQEIDRRSDVWSFGVVLWEMLTGARLFGGPTNSDTLAALLTREPDLSRLPTTVPPAVRRVLRGCLQRDPSRRFRDAGDLALLLQLEEAPVAGPSEVRRPRWGWIAAAIVLVGLVGYLASRGLAPAAGEVVGGGPPLALSILEPSLGHVYAFDLSPDGRTVALTLVTDGVPEIGLRELASFETRPVAGTEGGFNPFFSPDGSRLGYLTRTGLHEISLDGGAPQLVFELGKQVRYDPWDFGSLPTAVWLPDGSVVLSTGHWRSPQQRPGLLLISPGGAAEALTRFDAETTEYQHMGPEVTPDGRGILFTVRSRLSDRVEVVDLATRQRRVVLENAAEGHLVDGRYLVYLRDFYTGIAAVPVDERLQPTSSPKILFYGIDPYTTMSTRISADGSLVYRRGAVLGGNQRILEVNRSGAVAPVDIRPGNWMQPRLSRDGTRLLLRELGENCQIWQVDLRRNVLSRISDPTRDYHDAIWGDDGRQIIAGIQDDEVNRKLVRFSTSGRGSVEPIRVEGDHADETTTSRFPSSTSADGRFLLYTEQGVETDLDVWILDTASGRTTAVAATPALELGGRMAPSGDWIAYASDEAGRQEIFLVRWPGLDRRLQVSDAGGSAPFWARDGGSLFYIRGDRLMEVVIEDADEPRLSRPRVILHHSLGPEGWWLADTFPDGERFVIVAPPEGGVEELRVLTRFSERLDRLFAASG